MLLKTGLLINGSWQWSFNTNYNWLWMPLFHFLKLIEEENLHCKHGLMKILNLKAMYIKNHYKSLWSHFIVDVSFFSLVYSFKSYSSYKSCFKIAEHVRSKHLGNIYDTLSQLKCDLYQAVFLYVWYISVGTTSFNLKIWIMCYCVLYKHFLNLLCKSLKLSQT